MNVLRFINVICFLSMVNAYSLRSVLYPVDWTLGFNQNGAKLQDYSFAGYKNSNESLPNWDSFGLVKFKVDDYGGDPSGQSFSDDAIHEAIADAIANNGGIIMFSPGTYKIKDQFQINNSNIFIVGTKSVSAPSDTENFTNIITDYIGLPGNKPENLSGSYGTFVFNGGGGLSNSKNLAQNMEIDDTEIKLNSIDGFSVGDDIVIIRNVSSQWVNDWGMGSYWGDMIGENKVIEKRHIVSINTPGKKLVLNAPTRHFLKASEGSVKKATALIENVGVYNIRFNNALATIGTAEELGGNRMAFIKIANAKNAIISNIITFDRAGDSTNRHMADSGIMFSNVKDSTISNANIFSTQNRLENGHGYGLNLIATSHVLIHGSDIGHNRHNYVFNGNNLDKEGNAVVSSKSKASYAKNCSGDNGNGICVTIKAAGIDCHGSASVGMLFTDVTVDDKIECKNRKHYSSNAGQTGTNITMWNARGDGKVRFKGMEFHQDGHGFVRGYMIGTGPGFGMKGDSDWREHKGDASSLQPQNLFCDQLARRLTGGSCDLQLPVLTGYTPNQEACIDLLNEIGSLNNSIAQVQQTIYDILDQDPDGPIFGGGSGGIVITNLQNQIDNYRDQRDDLQNQYDTFNGVGCEYIMINGLVGPGGPGGPVDDKVNRDHLVDLKSISDGKERIIMGSQMKVTEAEKAKLSYFNDMKVEVDGTIESIEVLIESKDLKTGKFLDLSRNKSLSTDPSVQNLIKEALK
ncbi:glycoside hydrolase family 55 protein [Bacteriovoracaceae bacterium]|nr:glycoside hydrolase family 55 protein [Bacteriovoracaceae bacterium]